MGFHQQQRPICIGNISALRYAAKSINQDRLLNLSLGRRSVIQDRQLSNVYCLLADRRPINPTSVTNLHFQRLDSQTFPPHTSSISYKEKHPLIYQKSWFVNFLEVIYLECFVYFGHPLTSDTHSSLYAILFRQVISINHKNGTLLGCLLSLTRLLTSLRCEVPRIPTVTPPHSPWHGRLIGYSRLRLPSRLFISAAARNFNPLYKLEVIPYLYANLP